MAAIQVGRHHCRHPPGAGASTSSPRRSTRKSSRCIANLSALTSEAARAAALAARQAERLDRVFGEMVERVDKTLAAAHEFVTGPARQGMAIMAGVKAVRRFRSAACARRRAAAPRRGPAWTKRNRFSSADVLNGGMKSLAPLPVLPFRSVFFAVGLLVAACRRGRRSPCRPRRRRSWRSCSAAAKSTASPRACPTRRRNSSAR